MPGHLCNFAIFLSMYSVECNSGNALNIYFHFLIEHTIIETSRKAEHLQGSIISAGL